MTATHCITLIPPRLCRPAKPWMGVTPAPKTILLTIHFDWGRASAQQPKRVSVDLDGGNMHLADFADEVFERCEVCRTAAKAPHVPIVGTSAAPTFNGNLQVDLLSLDDVVALHASDVSRSTLSGSLRAREILAMFGMLLALLGLGLSGSPKSIQINDGGVWRNEVRTDLCSARRIKVRYHGVGARPWILDRRNGLARGILPRVVSHDRFSGGQALCGSVASEHPRFGGRVYGIPTGFRF